VIWAQARLARTRGCRADGGVLWINVMIASGKAEKRAARSGRLAAALRENLKRRKAQARHRAMPGAPDVAVAEAGSRIEAAAPDFRRNPGRNSDGGSGASD
jgi:hypothetical protein